MVNKAILIGNLGKDPEIRTMQNGEKMASFSIATSKRWKDKQTGEKKEKTTWHNIKVFNQGLAKVVEAYVKKGSKLYVEGEIENQKYTDKSGIDKYITNIVISGYDGNITLLDNNNSTAKTHLQAQENVLSPTQQAEQGGFEDLTDDIPF